MDPERYYNQMSHYPLNIENMDGLGIKNKADELHIL